MAQFSDPDAADWLATCLIKRRDKVGNVYLRRVLPLDNFVVADGRLQYEHLGEKYRLFDAPAIGVAWSHFDNTTEAHAPIAEASGPQLPTEVLDGPDGFYSAKLTGDDEQKTVSVFLKKQGRRYTVVGIDRTFPLPNK